MKILIVEDEKELSDSVVTFLENNNYICEQAFTLAEAVEKVELYTYDCVLLDLMLPDGDGLGLLPHIQKNAPKTGVIVVSARNSIDDKVNGLKLGADDYLEKPFHLSELAMRVFALIRRGHFSGENVLTTEELTVDLASHEVTAHEQNIVLTKSEYALLLFLIGNKGRVVSKEAIAEHLSGDMADMLDDFNFVYAHIKNLKLKLTAAGCRNCIRTCYGIGYSWNE
jgi:DNA-binding response OmpR family regulator